MTKLPAPSDAECPLDLSGFEPEAVIARWRAAHILDRGMERRVLRYDRGWFFEQELYGFRIHGRYRRRQLAAMIWRLENRPRATDAPIKPEAPYDDHDD